MVYIQRWSVVRCLSECVDDEITVDWSVEETRVLAGVGGKANTIYTSTCYCTLYQVRESNSIHVGGEIISSSRTFMYGHNQCTLNCFHTEPVRNCFEMFWLLCAVWTCLTILVHCPQ